MDANKRRPIPDYNPAEHPRTATDKAFRISIYLKGLDGLLEIAGGVLLLIISPSQINHLARWLTHGELSEDPKDFVATHILKTAHHLTGAALTFGAVYLLAHGVVKVVLVYEVIRDHLWAYLALISVTALFIIYQSYRMAVKFTFGMLLLTIFDVVVVYLTQNEYRKHKRRLERA
ncbi:MAG TPA: DUF2127 domain-containing protein [Candidatus Saccharimonadales bacterium]|nr:DUF2127 domain-containing protein [Candidatus Saccharimonadales bacterium]